MKKKSNKTLKAQADRLFSLAIRTNRQCENCGKRENLQNMHTISRSYLRTRFSYRNCTCGCARCHIHFTHNPMEFAEYVLASPIGPYVETERAKAFGVGPKTLDYEKIIETAEKVISGEISLAQARELDL